MSDSIPASDRPRRRRILLLVAAAVLVIAGAGAGVAYALRPASTGGGPSSEPANAAPEVGACYTAKTYSGLDRTAEKQARVDCEALHGLQTIAFWSGDGDAPDLGRLGQLIDSCREEAHKFLGMDALMTLARPAISIPSVSAWRTGTRWYRCDLLTVDRMFGHPATRQGRLSGHEEPVRCLTWKPGHSLISEIGPAPCDQAHFGELAGVAKVAIPESRDLQTLAAWAKDDCQTMITAYLGIALGPDLKLWFGEESTPPLDEFAPRQFLGNYTYVPCMIGAADLSRQFSGSLKGIGAAPIPFV